VGGQRWLDSLVPNALDSHQRDSGAETGEIVRVRVTIQVSSDGGGEGRSEEEGEDEGGGNPERACEQQREDQHGA
jgi:hypothetical protein